MKQVRLIFEDEDHKRITKIKTEGDYKNWEDFIIKLCQEKEARKE